MKVALNSLTSYKLSLVSVLICLIGFFIIVSINRDIAIHYQTTDGKGRALFGLILLSYSYRYYCAGLGLLGLIVALFGKKIGENGSVVISTLTLSLILMATAFIDFWRLWI